jgi:hemolysin III
MLGKLRALFRYLTEQPSVRLFSLVEETLHSISHGIGTGLAIVGLTVLVVLAVVNGDIFHIISFSIFGSSLVVLYLASTLYHGFQNPRLKQKFKIFDHAAIYLLIAGTYTPFLLISLRGTKGWTLLVVVWVIALAGVFYKIFFIERYHILSVVSYILMGWLCVFVFKEMLVSIPTGGIIWLAVGGLFYTIGVIFYALQKIPYMHVVWHFFVLAGSICHYFAVLLYLAPTQTLT